LTEHIINAKPRYFYAVEIDTILVEKLNERFREHVEIIQDDILKFDFSAMMTKNHASVKVIGNLPYHITSPIIFKLLDKYKKIDSAVLMIQKEVARRIASGHGNKEYGILSVITQAYSRVEYLFEVKRGNFTPAPDVDSAVIRFSFFNRPENIENEELFRKIVRQSFNYRRKILGNSLGRIFDKSIVYSALSDYLDQRPEQLAVEDFKILSNSLNQVLRRPNG
ncbi:MAG: 16S rRNA (adenine(1518)-N(6)/adenine(1519)-N(6))-dimethyltransferase RsmA, partial [Calditrichaceae bacterium]